MRNKLPLIKGIVNNKQALWVRVLKGLYFPNSSFLEAKKGGRASWCWNSLLEGREVIKEYGLWRIGDGETVSIWEDRWVPGLNKEVLKPACIGGENYPGKVKEWINFEEEDWNWEAVGEWISKEEKELVRQIMINDKGGGDKFVWSKEKNGEYSVKGGYRVMKEEKDRKEIIGPSSSYRVDNRIWKEIWKLEVPNKIKNFIWRLCTNSIATNDNLYRRKIKEDPVCNICWKEAETVEHICFTCNWTEPIWFGGWAGMRYRKEEVGRIEEWLLKLFSGEGVDEKIKAMIVVTCWFIWKERCSV